MEDVPGAPEQPGSEGKCPGGKQEPEQCQYDLVGFDQGTEGEDQELRE